MLLLSEVFKNLIEDIVRKVAEWVNLASLRHESVLLQEGIVDYALCRRHIDVHGSLHGLLPLHLDELIAVDTSLDTFTRRISVHIAIKIRHTSSTTWVIHKNKLGDVSPV